MHSYDEALQIIRDVALRHRKENVETVDLGAAVGRVLAESIFSQEAVPAFNNSAMDGFVVCARKTLHASVEHPAEFFLYGEIAAGDWHREEYFDRAGDTSCFEIMTGAPMPAHTFDAVVKVEDVEKVVDISGKTKIRVVRPLKEGENVRPLGTDIQRGQEILSRGRVLNSEMILAAAACGVAQVKVFRPLRVAVLSTGSELVELPSKSVTYFSTLSDQNA